MELSDIKFKTLGYRPSDLHRQLVREEARLIRPKVLEEKGWQCEMCGCSIVKVLEVHHKIAVHKGGGNELSNLMVLCKNCHALIEEEKYQNRLDRILSRIDQFADGIKVKKYKENECVLINGNEEEKFIRDIDGYYYPEALM